MIKSWRFHTFNHKSSNVFNVSGDQNQMSGSKSHSQHQFCQNHFHVPVNECCDWIIWNWTDIGSNLMMKPAHQRAAANRTRQNPIGLYRSETGRLKSSPSWLAHSVNKKLRSESAAKDFSFSRIRPADPQCVPVRSGPVRSGPTPCCVVHSRWFTFTLCGWVCVPVQHVHLCCVSASLYCIWVLLDQFDVWCTDETSDTWYQYTWPGTDPVWLN